MRNIDKQALRIPERKKHNWSQAVMRDCDFCQQWALTVRHSDGGSICASCCDSEYTTALYSALVVALDEMEAKDKQIAELSHHLQCAHGFIEHTEAFGHEASNGILCCGDAQWNIDESKSVMAAAGKGEAS
ncbi:hypothetical protein CF309_001794 [Enterobacter kobei]|nr:hypothetical protein [Enterobacter kobei]